MRLIFRKNISAWTMTGLLGKGARWFMGLSSLTSSLTDGGSESETWVLSSDYYKIKAELDGANIQLGEYNRASCDDVARMVEEVIRLREELRILKAINTNNTFSAEEINGIFTPELDPSYLKDDTYIGGQQYIVCAAASNTYNGAIICSPRHYDSTFHAAVEFLRETDTEQAVLGWRTADQGFVDQFGKFLTRAEARRIAVATGQIRRRCGGDHEELYSENLY